MPTYPQGVSFPPCPCAVPCYAFRGGAILGARAWGAVTSLADRREPILTTHALAVQTSGCIIILVPRLHYVFPGPTEAPIMRTRSAALTFNIAEEELAVRAFYSRLAIDGSCITTRTTMLASTKQAGWATFASAAATTIDELEIQHIHCP